MKSFFRFKIIAASICILAIFPFCSLIAQPKVCGIYKTSQDYTNHNLSFALNNGSRKTNIKLNHFFNRNYITINQNGKQIHVKKDSIFGYCDCGQNDFRFYHSNEKEYRITENNAVVIYLTDVPVTSSSGKIRTLAPAYFFSTTLNSTIYPLNIVNLKRAFPGNLTFHDELDIVFGECTSLSNYDDKHKMYMVNFLLMKSLTKL